MILGATDPHSLHVMSQNIRLHRPETLTGDPDHWGNRAPVLTEILRAEMPDVLGTQEVLFDQIPVLDAALGSTHQRLGYGRDGGGRGEHNLLFLRKERFTVLDWDQFWLAEDPRLIGSLGWEAGCTRICVWARVRDEVAGREIVLANTHLDHASEEARRRGAEVITQQLLPEAGGLPVVLVGDFNAAGGDSVAWNTFREAGFEDAHDVADRIDGPDVGTFVDYGEVEAGGERIDWILSRGLHTQTYGVRYPEIAGHHASDHASIAAHLQYV